jgi:hypothetical protein
MKGRPLSTLELHNLWKTNQWIRVEGHCDSSNSKTYLSKSEKEYSNLFCDIQLINSNDFLSNPFTSLLDIMTLKIRYIRWVDESNPKYNKVSLTKKLILFYYLPKISRICIMPVFIPLLIVMNIILLIRKENQRSQ